MCGRGGGAKYVVFFMNFTFRLWLARTWIRTFFSAFSFLEFFSSGNSFWKLTCVCCVYRTAFFVAVFLSIPCPALACGVRLSFGFSCFPSFLVFRLFLFSVCCFRMGSFLFPSLYARANIIMCVSFSSGVLRYKNMLCNTSVIQSITKKFQEIRIIFPSYVCWLSLKGLPLHPQSREMRHFRQCVTDLVKQT